MDYRLLQPASTNKEKMKNLIKSCKWRKAPEAWQQLAKTVTVTSYQGLEQSL
jgi:hypothetical protein